MTWVSNPTIFHVFSFVCVCLLLVALIKIFHKLWWAPTRFKHLLGLQGIQGPPYRFLDGSIKEILSMQKEAMAKPLGLSHVIFPKRQPHLHHWRNKYGKNYVYWNGTEAMLFVGESELVKEILSDRERVYQHKRKPQPYIKKLFGNGFSLSRGEKWAKKRKLATHTFQSDSLKSMIPAMIASVETMIEKWKYHQGKEIDVYDEFRFLSSEVISRTAFGSSYLEGKVIFEMLEKMTPLASRNTYIQRITDASMFFKTDDEIESEKLEKGVRNLIIEIIKKREMKVMNRQEKEKEEGFGNDFLGVILKAHHDTNETPRISVDDMVDECKSLYFSGQETTNSLLAWTVLLLAIHTDWQEDARNEVFDLFGKQNPNPDGISKLRSMDLIINESLRLYPPVTVLTREVESEVKLGNFNLPAKTSFFIPTLALHHDPQIWGDDVHLFRPERFSQGVANATGNNFAAFIPFSMGPRNCVGFNFAITETKIALTMILQRYAFTLSPAYLHSPIQVLILRPQYGLQVMLHPL